MKNIILKKITNNILLLSLLLINSKILASNFQNNEIDFFDDTSKKDNYFTYLKATYHQFNLDYSNSMQEYNKIFGENNSPNYVYDGYIRLLFETNQYKKIIDLKDKIEKSFQDNWEVQFMLANSYISLEKNQEAEEIFKKLSTKFPNNEQVAYYTAVSYIKNNQTKSATDFIDKCLANQNLQSKHFLFYFLKAKILLQLGNLNKSLELIDKCLNLSPNFDKGWLLKGVLSEQTQNIDNAIKSYKSYLELVGHENGVEKQLIHLLFSQKRFDEAAEILQQIQSDTPEFYFDLALLKWMSQDHLQAEFNINKALEKMPNFKKAKVLKIEILLKQEKIEETLNFIKNWLTQEPEELTALNILLLLKKVGIENDKLIEVLTSLSTKHKSNINFLAALSDMHLENNNLKEFVSCCKKLSNMPLNENLKSKIYFQLAYIYVIAKKEDKAEDFLKKSLQCQSVYPSSYNLIAYIYAEKEKNLDQALKYVDNALKSKPNCYYYLDTKGCVLLKMGKAKEALQIFQQALQICPQDLTIKQHLQKAQERVENLENIENKES